MRYFDRLHPAAAFAYFASVLLVAMFTMHPVIVGICFLSGVCFCGLLTGIRKLLRGLAFSLPLVVLLALTNPLFSHRGKTVLFSLFGTAFTLESVLYGATAAVMLLSVFYWFRCYNEIMTSDKFLCLFGKAAPKLALILSMTLSLVPRFERRYRAIDDAQRAIGLYDGGGVGTRLRGKLRVFSILLTGGLEGSIETADSMSARGYGLPGRSSYDVYRFRRADVFVLAWSLLLCGGVITLCATGAAAYEFYPTPGSLTGDARTVLAFILSALLAGSSIVWEVADRIVWHILKSKI